MGQTHFSGPVLVGTKTAGEPYGPNQGSIILAQTVAIQATGQANISLPLYVPQGAIILTYFIDTLTAWTAATAALSVGIETIPPGPGNQLITGLDIKTAGRITLPTFTSAQLAAMRNVTVLGVPVAAASQNKAFNLNVVSGTPTAVGYSQFTLLYVQTG